MVGQLSILNDPPKLLQGPQILHHLIKWDEQGTRCAIDFTNKGCRQQYSYHEVRSCVATLVARIQSSLRTRNGETDAHPSAQHVVPVLVPQSPGLYISQLAILNSGGAFCPINLDAPKERIKFVVGDVAATLIITTSEFKDVVSWENGPIVILVDEFPMVAETRISLWTSPDTLPEHLAYVMYTSGSSGTPKGVAVSHLAVSQSLLAHERHVPEFKRFLQFAAPSFDVSVFEIFFPLIRGCTLVGCDRTQLLNNLPETITELDVDAAELTPTVVASLLQKRANAPGLKLLLTIGEMLTWPIVEEFGASDTQSTMLYGMYGPTEAGIHCIIYPAMKSNTKPGNIGIPFDTVSTFIAAASNLEGTPGNINFLPIGELGELVLGGPQLAQGYLNREAQNKLAFIQAEGKNYYRTGDKARQLEDGTIEILGRVSAGQVKLRGQRIELGEIEEVIYKHPGIKTAAAVVLNKALIVFALIGDEQMQPDDVLKTCAKWLPKFMIPSEVILLRKFSYLPSGKVDKRKLEADYQAQQEPNDEDCASASTTEKIVKEILRELMGPFSTSMRLAAAGLDSLMAIRVGSKLRASGFDISTVSILKADTSKSLVRLCEESAGVQSQAPDTKINTTTTEVMAVLNGNSKDVESTMPCTPLQSAMLAETAADPLAYRNWVELELSSISTFEHVQSRLYVLAEQNAILRTGFIESPESDGFLQIIWRALEANQITAVERFNYASAYSSLYHPLQIQILQDRGTTRLLIHIHHALYDAWSLELILDDLDQILSGLPTVPHPPFASFVSAYQDGTLKTDGWSSKQYWKDHLDNVSLRKIPNFHTKAPSSAGLILAQSSTSISTAAVEATARRFNTSSQSIFQAAYVLILSSYLGSNDVCFGTVFSGRTLPVAGIEDIIGPCLATLPIRTDISMFQSIQELVQDLNSTTRKHLEHSAIPLRDIKSSCGVSPREPLFDTLLIWQQTLRSYDHTRKHVSLVDIMDNLEFNLTLEVIPSSRNIELRANYQGSIFPQSQIELLLKQVEGIAALVIGSEDISLNKVFSHLEESILSIENPSPETDLRPETLSSPVERIAFEDPNRQAIEFATSIDLERLDLQCMTYSELNYGANQLGHLLLSLNVLPDELVCIYMEKSLDLYTSILATAKIGAGYLPLTIDIPEERLQLILQQAEIKVVMAQSHLKPLLNLLSNIEVVYVDEIERSAFSGDNILPRSQPDHSAYCVFTSGSAGIPKGVLVTQGNILSNLDVLEEIYPITNASRLLQSCSQTFDVSVFEIFFTWRIGGCLCSAVKDVVFRDIELTIRKMDITHLSLTPTVAALINPNNVPRVQFLVTAGEAVTQKVFNAWVDQGLYQGYGPSETTNICTVNPKMTANSFINNIGPPFRNTSAFVLSPDGGFSPVLRGGEGEFCFGGSQVFRGYMDPTQDNGKIIIHPKFGRLYRSGDFGRLLPDGSLAFTARKDDQVKIRGQRVELGEISSVLQRSNEVRDCVTLVIEDEGEHKSQLVCFWVPGSDASTCFACLQPDPSVTSILFKSLEAALPVYMIPSVLIPVSHLPSTTQGKIDKRLLAKQYRILNTAYLHLTSQATSNYSDHEWTCLELAIGRAVSEVIKVSLDQIKLDTSFFTVGIDSISAISLSRIIRSNTHHQVEISDILKYPSVSRLAERLLSCGDAEAKTSSSSSEAFNFNFNHKFVKATTDLFEQAGKRIEVILPCTPLQEAMISARKSSSEELYNNSVVLNVNGNLEKIQECWKQMVQRHQILRTCFVSTDMHRYAYAQVVLQNYELEFGLTNVSDVRENILQLVGSSRRCEVIDDLSPAYSINVVSSTESTKLVILMHHALYDGEALAILYEEVEKLYHDEPLLTPVSFAPFLRTMTSMNINESDRFWGGILKDYSPINIKNHFKQPKFEQGQGHSRIQKIKAKFSLSWMEETAKRNRTSILAVCHTAWAKVLAERLHEKDICFGNIVSGRTLPVDGIERLVAPCFNTVPVLLPDVHTLSYTESFRKLQNLNAESLPFQLTPLRRLQSKFSPNGSRLFDSLFILQQSPRVLDSAIWSISEDSGVMDFPLVCEAVPKHTDDTLEISLHSYASIISSSDALSLLELFFQTIEESLTSPRKQILSPQTRDKVIASSIAKEQIKEQAVQAEFSSGTMTSAEMEIRDIMADFTDVPVKNIGKDISIFRLGLDSISTVQVASRLRNQGHNIMASDILEHPTITQLAVHLGQSANNTSTVAQYDFQAFDLKHRASICAKTELISKNILAVRLCTAVQCGMIAQSLHSNGEEYVNSIWLDLLPEVSLSKLRDAWDKTCHEHDMLRTGFVQTDDPKTPFVMVTSTKESFQIPFYEVEQGRQPPSQDLQHPWFLLLERDHDRKILKFRAHHALYDAQTIRMILADVAKTYISDSPIVRPPINSLLGAILCDNDANQDDRRVFWQKEENKIIINRFPELTPLHVYMTTSTVKEITSQNSTAILEESCRKHGVTMQAAGQAAWARLLAAYTGEVSTTFGMTLSGRSIHEDADRTPFPSIVTLPVRCNVSGTNADLLSRTMSSNAQLHKQQFTPLTSIQKWSGFPEGKIFDTLFTYQKLLVSEDSIEPPWDIIREEASVNYAVSLEVQPITSGELTLRLTFREDIIPVDQSTVILRQYDALLSDLLHNPQSPCDIAPSIGTELLSITPAQDFELPSRITLLHQFVERGAKQWPNKDALEFATRLDAGNLESQRWTYEELDCKGNQIAHMLISRKVDPGDIIAICFDKCPEATFSIIGILKAGCAYVALDPNAPVNRLKYIIKDSGAKLVLTAGRPGLMIVDNIDKDIITIDSPEILINYSPGTPKLSRKIEPQDVSYCLYTSGTTGTPKGCLLTHENAVQAMLAFQRLFAGHWTEESKWLQFASFHFDVSVLEQFWSWSVGICVASAPRDLIFEDIPGTIQRLGITHIDLTPSLARLLHPDDVPSLCKGVFITGGEQLRQEILDVWGEHACIYNGYGPTEATIGVTMYPRVPKNGKPSNIGPQFDNVGSFILKPGTSLPVLRGGVGELCVSGKLVGKGYLNRPELTTDRFPTLEAFDERVYRTGDLVRILHDGSFIFLGRADDQVKLRGQRLELSEINEVIKKGVQSLQDVVTLVLKHSAQQKEQLVTFFVPSPKPASREFGSVIFAMRRVCKTRLPGYMVPTHFIFIEKLPLNANNKADSKQLAAIYNEMGVEDLQKLSHSDQQDVEWSQSENKIAQIIATTLQLDTAAITRGSNIFELGLDSISIIGFSRALQNSGLEHAKLSVVKSYPNIGDLVVALSNPESNGHDNESSYFAAVQKIAAFSQKNMVGVCRDLSIEVANVEALAPCTPVQEGMIYRFLESDFPLYFNKFNFEINEKVDTELLLSAWKSVVAGSQILRTRFVATDDGYAQVVLKDVNISWGDFSLDYAEIDKSEALKLPYALDLQSSQTSTIMKLTIFHSLYDGNSLTMLLQKVVEEMNTPGQVEYGPAFQSSLPYGPLATIKGAQEFWTKQFENWRYDPIILTSEFCEDVTATRSIKNISGFEDLRKSLGVAPQAVVQAAWLSVLQTVISNPTIGIVTSGRAIDFKNAENVIGPLFNTVPFHCNVSSAATFTDLILYCHKFNMDMQGFQHTPLKDIQKWSPSRPGQALFETLFVFQHFQPNEDIFAKDIWTQVADEQVADYPLAFEATLDGNSNTLNSTIVAQGSVISKSDAEALLIKVEKALRDIISSNGKARIVKTNNHSSHAKNSSPNFSLDAVTQGNPVRETFKWTTDMQSIRSEIALLAKVSEDAVNETSSVFELGLDSIDVIKLSSRMKKQGIEIPVSLIIKCQNISKIATKFSTSGFSPTKLSSGKLLREISQSLTEYLQSVGKQPDAAHEILPATPLQQSMVNEMIQSGYERYFNIDVLKLGEGINPARLMTAIKKTVQQSPIFRATFTKIDDPRLPVSYAQLIPRMHGIESIATAHTLPSGSNLSEFMESFKLECIRRAKEEQALFQVHFIDAGNSQYFAMAVAHALYDGSSMRAFHEDVTNAYYEKILPRPDFKPFLEQVVQSTTNEANNFWKATLSNLPPANFPLQDSSEGNKLVVHKLEKISQVSVADIERLCKSSRITLQTVGQTCWALVLAHLMGQVDVIYGSVLSCRDTEEANEVMFPLMNTVAVRSVLHGSLGDMLTHMQNLSNTTRQYQHFPLGKAQVYALASRHDQASSSDAVLFDTLFIYQGRRQSSEKKPLYDSVYGASEVEFPVCVEMEILDDQIIWTTACKSSARDETQAREVLELLDIVLGRLISDVQAPTIVSGTDGISICGLPKVANQIQPKKPIQITNKMNNKWSDTEIMIRKALHELSDVPEDSIDKNSTIFHLGLDSVLILKFPAILKKYGMKLSVSDILREQTVYAMGKFIGNEKPECDESFDVDAVLSKAVSKFNITRKLETLKQEVGEIENVMPATAGQIYMIRQWQASRGTMFYPTFSYSISGIFHKAQLESAWKQFLSRNDILRTGFIEVGDGILQVTFNNLENEVLYITTKVDTDLRTPPVNLIVEDVENKTIIKLRIHHALYDGISLPVLVEELQSLYSGNHSKAVKGNFKAFVAQSLFSSSSTTKDKWVSYLSHASSTKLNPTPPNNKRTEIFHPSLQTKDLKLIARKSGVTIDALLLAAISKQYAGQLQLKPHENITLGLYLSNRAPFGEDLSALAAPTLNLLPICVSGSLNKTIEEVAKGIQEDLAVISRKDMVSASLAQIYEWTGVGVNLFINILKLAKTSKEEDASALFHPLQSFENSSESVDIAPDERMEDVRFGAYGPTIDIEMRYYDEGIIDIGIFAPTHLFSVTEGEAFIDSFRGKI